MANYDAVIVGAGISGLTTGALLCEQGKKVLILEKAPTPGGRFGSIQYRGHVLDDGAHMPSDTGHVERVFETLGLSYPKLHRYVGGDAWIDGAWKPMKQVFPVQDAREALGWIATMPWEEVEQYYNVSVKDWYTSQSEEEGWGLMWTYLAQIGDVGNKPEDLSMGEAITFFKEHFERGLKLHEIGGTASGGLSRITDPLKNYVEGHGGEIRLNTAANDIIVDEGQVRGVEIETGERLFRSQVLDTEVIEAPVVIAAVPLWDLFKVISEDEFPVWYRDWIHRLEKKVCHVWTIVWAVDKPLWDVSLFRWSPKLPRTGVYGVFFQHQSYGDGANEIQVNLAIQGSYNDLPDLSEWQSAKTRRHVRRVLDNMMEDAKELIPGLASATKWSVSNASFFGLSESPGIAGMHRPPMVPPGIENLYMISDTVNDAKGLGAQGIACASAKLVDRIVSKG